MSSSDICQSPLKILGDLSNNQPDTVSVASKTMSSENLMESPVKKDENISRTYEEIRELIDPALFTKICEAVHHDKSSNTLEDEVEEVMEEILPQFYPKEYVHFKNQSQSEWGIIHSSEKRGAMRFYYLIVDGVKQPNKLDGSCIRRKYSPSEKDVRIIIENIAEKEPGKSWVVHEDLRKEFGIKDKFAAIFCSPKQKKNLPTTTGRQAEASSSEDENPSDVRRLSGIAPTKASKKKAEKPPTESKQKGRPKKVKTENEEGKKKEEKKEKKPRKQKEKPDGALSKFVKQNGSPDGTSPFTTSQKRAEKKIASVLSKLNEAWKKRDYSEFLKSANWGAKVLSGVQIDGLPNECFRIAVRRVFDLEKDKQHLKKLGNKEKKKEYRQNVMHARKASYKGVESRVKAHFSGKEIVEDLTLDDNLLPCPGRPITFTDNRTVLFSDCLMVTQFLSTMKQFTSTGTEELTTAENLCNGLHEGRPGYYKYTTKIIIPMVKTLLQDIEYKLHTHFDARLHEFPITEANVSELVRSLLIGKTKKEKKHKVVGSSNQQADDDDEEEEEEIKKEEEKEEEPVKDEKDESVKDEEMKQNGVEDGNEENEQEMKSQEEMEEIELMLSRFTPAHEIWQLAPSIQMDLLKILLIKIIELESCRDFLTEETISDEARNLKGRIAKLESTLQDWRDNLQKMPEVNENVDESTLSRHQTKQRAELIKKRDNLEWRIEDQEDKLGKLVDKLNAEKMMQAQSKRLGCIGEDRHCRRYYWVPHKSIDAGLWIQDVSHFRIQQDFFQFGVTVFEKFVKKCVSDGLSLEEDLSTMANGITSKNSTHCDNEMNVEVENWFRVDDLGVLDNFMSSLKNGVRERELKKFLTNNLELITKAIRHGSQERSVSTDLVEKKVEEEIQEGENDDGFLSENPLDGLKSTTLEFYYDLRSIYLTTLDVSFETRVVSCESFEEIKECIRDLADSVNPNSIQVKLDFKQARESGSYSWFVLDKWKARLAMAQNAAAVHLLLVFFASRIDSKNSIKEKRCSVCNSKRSPECKIACSECDLVCHYYCARPRLQEKPSTWVCVSCNRQTALRARASKTKPKYVESDTEEEEEEDEEEEEEVDNEPDQEEEIENDETAEATEDDNTLDPDIFAADSDEEVKPKSREASKKRAYVVSEDEQQDEEEGDIPRTRSGRAKRSKPSGNKEVIACWEKVKAANRMYRSLQNIPAPRKSRSKAPVTLDSLENGLLYYSDFESFVADLRVFLDNARDYFENHNERKLDELDELIISLNLPSA